MGHKVTPTRGRAVKTAEGIVSWDSVDTTPLTHGEKAYVMRVLTSDPRLRGVMQVGRYSQISVERYVDRKDIQRRLAVATVYDYSQQLCINGLVDVQSGEVVDLLEHASQPQLSAKEQQVAMGIVDDLSSPKMPLVLGILPYWKSDGGPKESRLAVAVLGDPTGLPAEVLIVDLAEKKAVRRVPAKEW